MDMIYLCGIYNDEKKFQVHHIDYNKDLVKYTYDAMLRGNKETGLQKNNIFMFEWPSDIDEYVYLDNEEVNFSKEFQDYVNLIIDNFKKETK